MEYIKKIIRENYILFFIVILSLVIRTYNLSSLPYGFFCDEASVGYNAYSILNTGKDEGENVMPMFFKAFGEYKNPIQIYSSIIPIFLLGLNEFSVRIPSVFYGTATIVALYFLANALFSFLKVPEKKLIGVVSALILSITPWHVHLSRISLEGIMPYVFFTTVGTYLFLKTLKIPYLIFPSIFAFALALYSYFPARVFIPLFCFLLSALYFNFFLKHKIIALVAVLFTFLLVVPLMTHLFFGNGFSRWKQVSVFDNPPDNTRPIQHIVSNYLLHFSPDFLFLKGDSGMIGTFITRHSVKNLGELYLFQIFFIFVGITFLLNKNKKISLLLLGWVMLYPIGSSLTLDKNPQATRSAIGVIPLTILTAIGIWYFVKSLSFFSRKLGYISIIFLIILIFINTKIFVNEYFNNYVMYSSDYWGWQYGPRDIMSHFLDKKNNYDELIIMGNFNSPEIFIKFYDPTNKCAGKCKIGDHNLLNPDLRQLFAIENDKLQEVKHLKFIKYKTLYYPNNKPAFFIGELRYN